ncbi:hypothetical protein V2W45_1342378 [Cenococcum geophilum]
MESKEAGQKLADKGANESDRLEICLSTSGLVVQAEYDRGFRTDVVQNALLSNIFDISYTTLLAIANNVRQDPITALVEQYQRMMAAQPPWPPLTALLQPGAPVDRSKADFNTPHLYCGIDLLLQQTSGPMPLRFGVGFLCWQWVYHVSRLTRISQPHQG